MTIVTGHLGRRPARWKAKQSSARALFFFVCTDDLARTWVPCQWLNPPEDIAERLRGVRTRVTVRGKRANGGWIHVESVEFADSPEARA